MRRRERIVYFEREPGAPAPLCVTVSRRAAFNEVDAMGIVWYGHYARYFEEAAAELGRRCGLSYRDFFAAGLRAPMVRFHVDYLGPLNLDEEFSVRGALIWNAGARMNTEYAIAKSDGTLAARGYTVQLFVPADGGAACFATPPLLERCRRRWSAGEFRDLQ